MCCYTTIDWSPTHSSSSSFLLTYSYSTSHWDNGNNSPLTRITSLSWKVKHACVMLSKSVITRVQIIKSWPNQIQVKLRTTQVYPNKDENFNWSFVIVLVVVANLPVFFTFKRNKLDESEKMWNCISSFKLLTIHLLEINKWAKGRNNSVQKVVHMLEGVILSICVAHAWHRNSKKLLLTFGNKLYVVGR